MRFSTLVVRYPHRTKATNSTAPPGVPYSKLSWAVNPKDSIRRLKKFVKPPFGMSNTSAKKTKAQVMGSNNASLNWCALNSLLPIPCWFARTRSIANRRSSLVSQRAFNWLSGMRIQKRTPNNMVTTPVNMKIIFHDGILYSRIDRPYATRPPKIWARPLNEAHSATRKPCSLLVYHFEWN